MSTWTFVSMVAKSHIIDEIRDNNHVNFNKLIPIDESLYEERENGKVVPVEIALNHWGTKWHPDGYSTDLNEIHYSVASGDGYEIIKKLMDKYPDELIYFFCEYIEEVSGIYKNDHGIPEFSLFEPIYKKGRYEDSYIRNKDFLKRVQKLTELIKRLENNQVVNYKSFLKYDGLLLKYIPKQNLEIINIALKNDKLAIKYVLDLDIKNKLAIIDKLE